MEKDYDIIHDTKNRLQVAQHIGSSLQQPELELVEAKLLATRQRNHQIAMEYFKKKHGNPYAYQEFLESNQLTNLIPTQAPANLYHQELEQKAKKSYIKDIARIKARNKEPFDPSLLEQQLVPEAGVKGKSKHNPWLKQQLQAKKKKKDKQVVKLSEYEAEKEGEYLQKFKNYLNVKKQKGTVSGQDLNVFGKTVTSMMEQSTKAKKLTEASPKCYEEELLKKIYNDIAKARGAGKHTEDSRMISVDKMELVEYLTNHERILKVLGIAPSSLTNSVMGMHSKHPSEVSFREGLAWILVLLGKQKEYKRILKEEESSKNPEGCMLTNGVVSHFEQVFKQMDQHKDLIVKRMEFVQRLATDPIIRKHLNFPAVYEPQIQRAISLRRIFQRIELESLLGNEQDRKANQYISWTQFMKYFQSGNKDKTNYDIITLVNSLCRNETFGLGELPAEVAELLSAELSSMGKEEYFNTYELLQRIMTNPNYEHKRLIIVRPANQDLALPSQNLEDVLIRIKSTAHNFINSKEFLQYFSERGKPIDFTEQNISKVMTNSYQGAKVKFTADAILQQPRQDLDGYDSDPEFYHNTRSPHKSKDKKQQEVRPPLKPLKVTPSAYTGHLTIPIPFKFDERQRMRSEKKFKMGKMNRSESEIKTEVPRFKPKPIPKKVAEVGLYEKIMEDQQRLAKERKKTSMLVTLANEQPFSFYHRRQHKKTKQERINFVFKAKPIPWFCSINLMEKKKHEEIQRNEKIAKTAQEHLARAKLPPRMEKDYQQKLIKKAMEEKESQKRAQTAKKARDPPDFERLHKQFEGALERKRKENKKTVIEEFNFAKLNPRQNRLEQKDAFDLIDQMLPHTNSGPKTWAPKVEAKSTAKFTQQVEQRRKEIEQKRIKEEGKQKKSKPDEKVKEQLRNYFHLKKVQEEEAKKKMGFQSRVNQRITAERKQYNGRNQPLLMERPLKRDQRFERMKKLAIISDNLISNGIRGRNHDSYFTKEELMLIRDYEQLRKRM